VEWIHLAQDKDRWRALVNAVMNPQVLAPQSYLILKNVCVVINIHTVTLLWDFGSYGIIIMTMCVYYFRFSCHF
jgi:hypothetical protein